MWIKRDYKNILLKAAKTFPAVLLTGPRQVGKTSILRKIFPDYGYVTLDIPSVAEQAETNPELFLEEHASPVIIDEIQYAPSIFRTLKYVIDQQKDSHGRYLLTGSQDFLLMQNVSESLSGRCAVLNLHTLSVREIRRKKKADEFRIMLTGGFPELWANEEIDHNLWYSSYLTTYLERDVRNILNVGSLRDFERYLRALAARTGQLLSYSDLARDVGISVSTAREWLSVLRSSGQVFILEPYFKNLGKRLVKSPKVYLADIGLALFLNGIRTRDQLLGSPLIGHLWETFVIGNIYRYFMCEGLRPDIWFWRNRAGAEVDCVIDTGGSYHLYEIKFSEHTNNKDLAGFKAFRRMYGSETVQTATVLCRTRKRYRPAPDAEAVNVLENLEHALSPVIG